MGGISLDNTHNLSNREKDAARATRQLNNREVAWLRQLLLEIRSLIQAGIRSCSDLSKLTWPPFRPLRPRSCRNALRLQEPYPGRGAGRQRISRNAPTTVPAPREKKLKTATRKDCSMTLKVCGYPGCARLFAAGEHYLCGGTTARCEQHRSVRLDLKQSAQVGRPADLDNQLGARVMPPNSTP